MAFPKSPVWQDGDVWNGAAVNDLENRAASAISAAVAGIPTGSASSRQLLTRPGLLATETVAARLPIGATQTIKTAEAMVNTAPTGASLIIDVLKNGVTIWGTNPGNRPTIAASAHDSGAATPDTTSVTTGDYLQIQIVQVGATVPGSDLTVLITLG